MNAWFVIFQLEALATTAIKLANFTRIYLDSRNFVQENLCENGFFDSCEFLCICLHWTHSTAIRAQLARCSGYFAMHICTFQSMDCHLPYKHIHCNTLRLLSQSHSEAIANIGNILMINLANEKRKYCKPSILELH